MTELGLVYGEIGEAIRKVGKWAAIGWSESLRIELDREKSPVKLLKNFLSQ